MGALYSPKLAMFPSGKPQAGLAEPPAAALVTAMLFGLKKFLGFVLMPLPLTLLLLTAGSLLLCTRRRRTGLGLMLIATLLLLLAANKTVSRAALRPLEFRYPPVPEFTSGQPIRSDLAACRYVVVLGGGNGNTPGRPALSQLSQSALGRVTEGVRLLRNLPDTRLLVTGPADGNAPSHATMLARAAISLGIAPDRIERLEHGRDTEEEAEAVRRTAGDAPVAVVTSAWHLPRAMALFRSAGVTAVGCPADFQTSDDGERRWGDLLWDVESLERSTWAWRERLGYLWISLRGKG
jgi:uncharacterized SAM-binding protein YcdF (DUF218 family)